MEQLISREALLKVLSAEMWYTTKELTTALAPTADLAVAAHCMLEELERPHGMVEWRMREDTGVIAIEWRLTDIGLQAQTELLLCLKPAVLPDLMATTA